MFRGERRPGPGRSDAFNVGALQLLGLDVSDAPHANADFGVAWRADAEPGDLVNWDGNSDDIHESNVSVVLTLGASGRNLDEEGLRRAEAFSDQLAAPAYPYAIDARLAERGAAIFEAECARCHTRGGERFMTVIDASEIGTDPERAQITTPEMVEQLHTIGEGEPWQFSRFRASSGYLAGRLDGLWLRAPYLHNGSVPTLRDLLSPPEERPDAFYRGGDVYDPASVGFVSSEPLQGERELFLYDTALRGNGAEGHRFGTELGDADREALLEYLKTL